MVFSSVPAYLDPSSWQPINHQIIGSTGGNPAAAAPQQQHAGSGSGSGSTRPGSMTERARMANIPMPEAALKCPRCESTNTKFCYFNNYSLSQPRHFCKTCRRYWTRGGALRSVPVGGGCRRNKRTKSSSLSSASKSSPATSDNNKQMANPGLASGGSSFGNSNNPTNYIGNLLKLTPQFQPLRLASPRSQLGENLEVSLNNYAGVDEMGFQGGPTASNLPGIEPWRLHPQFSFLGGLDLPPAVVNYQFGGTGGGGDLGLLSGGELRPPGKIFTGSLLSQMAAVKMEEQNPNLSLSRQLLGGIQPNGHQWSIGAAGGGAPPNWTELSTFSSSSTSNHLQ